MRTMRCCFACSVVLLLVPTTCFGMKIRFTYPVTPGESIFSWKFDETGALLSQEEFFDTDLDGIVEFTQTPTGNKWTHHGNPIYSEHWKADSVTTGFSANLPQIEKSPVGDAVFALFEHTNGVVPSYSVGDIVTVNDGIIAGWDGVLILDAGVPTLTPADVTNALTTLPKYTGQIRVDSFFKMQVIPTSPEPSALTLAALSLLSLGMTRRRRRR